MSCVFAAGQRLPPVAGVGRNAALAGEADQRVREAVMVEL